ncbi:MAG: DNA mismatch repair endonuclease MutL [Clostridia bacterium]|nr:DNA mismatch repair endonuclease MutL [Clostridia bacterium]
MGIINILDSQTANLIAAGEVVERPSSAAKEMLENSIDAGAKNITLEIKSGGRSLVRVIDDGCGFLREDIPKALLRHATSKISCGDDINGIRSLGFRGEALAAIGSVSKLDIVTKHRSEEIGTRLTADEDGVVMVDTGCPDGITVSMRDIFYNTPARQKFLKKDSSEGASCVAVAEKLALSHPDISFTVIADGERKFSTSGDGKLYNTIYSVLGRQFAKTLAEVDYTHESVRAYGFVTTPDGARGSRNMQNAFVNGRYVKSKTVQAALEEAFRSYIPHGKYPGCVLFIDLPAELTDVNVHPAKTEIKFASERDVFRAVYYGIKTALEAIPKDAPLVKAAEPTEEPLIFDTATLPQEEIERPQFKAPEKPADVCFFTQPAQPQEKKPAPAPNAFVPNLGEDDIISPETEFVFSDKLPQNEPLVIAEQEEEQQTIAPQTPYWRMIGQAYNAYIFVETADNILVIDKHAAHERILYEQLAKNKELHVQELLSGVPVDLGREQAEILLENSAYLAEKGFNIESFGDGSIIVRSVPATLHNLKGLASLLEDFANALFNGNHLSFSERCDRALYTVACKAALKAGVKNRPEDDENVVRMLSENPSLRYCPHGRPFIKTIPKREVEKYFDR